MSTGTAAVLIASIVAGLFFQAGVVLAVSLRQARPANLSEPAKSSRAVAATLVAALLVLAGVIVASMLVAGLPVHLWTVFAGTTAGAMAFEFCWLGSQAAPNAIDDDTAARAHRFHRLRLGAAVSSRPGSDWQSAPLLGTADDVIAFPPSRQRRAVNPLRGLLIPVALLCLTLGTAGAGIVTTELFPATSARTSPSPSPTSPSPTSPSMASPPAFEQFGYRRAGSLDPGVPGSVTGVAWAPAGALVATSDQNGSTYIWDVATRRPAGRPFSGPARAFADAFSPDGRLLATGYSNGATYLWDVETGKRLAWLHDPGPSRGRETDSVAFSPDGKTLATSDGDGYTNLWRVPSRDRHATLTARLPDPGGTGVFSAVFSSKGTLATGDYNGKVYIWNLRSRTIAATFQLSGGGCPTTICAAVSAMAFTADGDVLAAGNESGNAELWSVASGSGSPLNVPSDAIGRSIWSLSFSPSGLLAMADSNGRTYLYHVSPSSLTASLIGALPDPQPGLQGVSAAAFSPDGKYLITGDTNGNAYVWQGLRRRPR